MAVIMWGITQVSALGSSEASASQRFKCIGIMGSSNGATQLPALGAVSSLGRVRFRRFHCNSVHNYYCRAVVY